MVEYFKKSNITTDPLDVADVNLYSYFQDLADGTSTSLKITGGVDSTFSLLQFPVAASPSTGESKIKRFDLKFYVNDVETSPTSMGALSYDIYNLKRNTQVTEGEIKRELTDLVVVGSNVSSTTTPDIFKEHFNDVETDASAVFSDKAVGLILGDPYQLNLAHLNQLRLHRVHLMNLDNIPVDRRHLHSWY